MLLNKLISTGFGLTLTAIAVLGGIQGNTMTVQAAADLNARNNVSTLVMQNDIAVQSLAASQARTTVEAFVPTLDAADALVASSDGKASAEARSKLASIVTEYKVVTGAHFADAIEFRTVVDQSVATATVTLASTSETVSAEVAAWQAAEDARIAAEAEAAAQTAREAEQRSYGNGDGGNSGSNGGGGSNDGSNGNGGGGNSGGDRAEQWRQIAAGQGINCFSVIPGSVSYYSSGCIQIGQNPLDANAERVLWHEIAHHYTAGMHSYTVQCTKLARELGGDIEVWAQGWTQVNLGWSMPQYPSASQSFIDGMRAAGCGI